MNDNSRVLNALAKAIELNPDIEIGKYIRYITSIDDLAYMTDENIACLFEQNNYFAKKHLDKGSHNPYFKFNPEDKNYFGDIFLTDDEQDKADSLKRFSKENEQVAYDRYKKYTENKVFIDLKEELDCSDFLKRFPLLFVNADDFKGIHLINHCSKFWRDFPIEYRHMNFYGVGWKDDKYLAFHSYACKNPCFGELFCSATRSLSVPVKGGTITHNDLITKWASDIFDEYFTVVIDWAESPRFTNYTNCIMYGVVTRPSKNEIEIYNVDQTIEIFHELMQKSNKITDEWYGVLFDDGSLGDLWCEESN